LLSLPPPLPLAAAIVFSFVGLSFVLVFWLERARE
jgi:hypothetical protein